MPSSERGEEFGLLTEFLSVTNMYCWPLYIFREMVHLLLRNGPFGRINPIFMLLHLFVAFHTDIMTQIRGLMMVMRENWQVVL